MVRVLGVCLPGIIPANTGRIISSVIFGTSGTDHPREYGENEYRVMVEHDGEGSSPRIRGEWHQGEDPQACRGIIPANTGRILKLC